MKLHPKQYRFWSSTKRFVVVPAGRRSGKTKIAIRRAIRKACRVHEYADAWIPLAAPTRGQAKRLFWEDLQRLTPPEMIAGRPSQSDLSIRLINGAMLQVIGLDVPQRVEGTPIVHILVDEVADVKPRTWELHIRPSLTDRNGSADFIGVPEGRGAYFDLWEHALAHEDGEWAGFTWTSEEILPIYLGKERADAEIMSAKATLDEKVYGQEYLARFVDFQGRVYYNFSREIHASRRWTYNPSMPLFFCFDFNVEPGVAAIAQEFEEGTVFIDEVYIPRDSNTILVCHKLGQKFHDHSGDVFVYGDATGGARGSAKVLGSDWDLIRKELPLAMPRARVRMRFPDANPQERVRINSVNSRLLSSSGAVRLFVDPIRCPNICKDFEGVRVLEGSAGAIDKKADPKLTHISDAIGYFIDKRYPIDNRNAYKVEAA